MTFWPKNNAADKADRDNGGRATGPRDNKEGEETEQGVERLKAKMDKAGLRGEVSGEVRADASVAVRASNLVPTGCSANLTEMATV